MILRIGVLKKNVPAKFHVKGNGGSLLGKPSGTELDLLIVGLPVSFEHIVSIKTHSPEIQNILQDHREVFSGGGKSHQYNIRLEEFLKYNRTSRGPYKLGEP